MIPEFSAEDLALDLTELIVQERFRRRRHARLIRHPDPRDPDHPYDDDDDDDQESNA